MPLDPLNLHAAILISRGSRVKKFLGKARTSGAVAKTRIFFPWL